MANGNEICRMDAVSLAAKMRRRELLPRGAAGPPIVREKGR